MLYNVLDKTSETKEFNFFEFKLNGTMSVQYNKLNKKIFLSGGLYYEDSIFSRSKLFSDTLYIFDFNNTLIIGNKIYFIGGKDARGNYIFECDSYNMKEKI